MSIEKRLRAGAITGDADCCWPWARSLNTAGYGNLHFEGDYGAHRVAFRVWRNNGAPLPPGALVCHTCDNRSCINPNHLYLGTPKTNMRDKVRRGRCNSPRGSDHHNAVMTEDTVREIRREYDAGGVTHAELAKKHGVSRATVSRVCGARDRFWTHVD